MDQRLTSPQFYLHPVTGKAFGVRAVAFIIDAFVLYAVGFVVGTIDAVLLETYLANSYRPAQPDLQQSVTALCVSLLVSALQTVAYFTVFEWLYGATPGKLALGMRVIKENGELCDLQAAQLRAWLRLVDGLFFGVPAYISMKAPYYQRIGDQAARTVVIGAHDLAVAPPRSVAGLYAAAALCLALNAMLTMFPLLLALR